MNTRPTDEVIVTTARRLFVDDDVQIDKKPVISRTTSGAWVASWVYVRFDDIPAEPE